MTGLETPRRLDVMICASPADAAGLLPVALHLLLRNLQPLGHVYVVTPDPATVSPILAEMPPAAAAGVSVLADADVCPEAVALDPWFRQQYIKLHADRLATTRSVVCLGADTLLLDPMGPADLIDGRGVPLLRYFRYPRPAPHLDFERRRVLNVARLFGTPPRRSFLLGDFICDLFTFQVDTLRALRRHLSARGGLSRILTALGQRQGFDNRFGEWTAYAVFVLDVLELNVRTVASTPTFFHQIHSRWDLRDPGRYSSRVVHFVTEPGGAPAVIEDLRREGILFPPTSCQIAASATARRSR